MHGIASNAYLWRHVISAVAAQRRCIAVDLPLHGQSPVAGEQDLSLAALAAGLEDFCEALGLTGINLVANDTGGAIAQIFAARQQGRLATFTLTNCDTRNDMPPDAMKPLIELPPPASSRRPPSRCSPTWTPPRRPRSRRCTSTWTRWTGTSSAPTWSRVSARWCGPASSSGC